MRIFETTENSHGLERAVRGLFCCCCWIACHRRIYVLDFTQNSFPILENSNGLPLLVYTHSSSSFPNNISRGSRGCTSRIIYVNKNDNFSSERDRAKLNRLFVCVPTLRGANIRDLAAKFSCAQSDDMSARPRLIISN